VWTLTHPKASVRHPRRYMDTAIHLCDGQAMSEKKGGERERERERENSGANAPRNESWTGSNQPKQSPPLKEPTQRN